MAAIKKLQPGQTVWEVRRQKMGNTTLTYGALYTLRIKEVHADHVIASWNGNRDRRYDLTEIRKWKTVKPVPKKKVMGTNSY